MSVSAGGDDVGYSSDYWDDVMVTGFTDMTCSTFEVTCDDVNSERENVDILFYSTSNKSKRQMKW